MTMDKFQSGFPMQRKKSELMTAVKMYRGPIWHARICAKASPELFVAFNPHNKFLN